MNEEAIVGLIGYSFVCANGTDYKHAYEPEAMIIIEKVPIGSTKKIN